MYSDLCYVWYWSYGLDGHLVNICHTGPSKAKFITTFTEPHFFKRQSSYTLIVASVSRNGEFSQLWELIGAHQEKKLWGIPH